MSGVNERLRRALEEALFGVGCSAPLTRAAALVDTGKLAEALRRVDLTVADTRPPLPDVEPVTEP